MYRDEHRGQYVAWQQSSNPLEATGQVKGFRVLQWGPRARDQDDSSSFSGLSFDGEHSLMGCRGMEHRWFGVGAYRELDGGGLAALKEAQETPSMCVELLVAVEPAGVNSLLERISQGSENQVSRRFGRLA